MASRGAEAGRTFCEPFGATPPPDVTLTWQTTSGCANLSFRGALEEALKQWERAFDDTTEPPTFRQFACGAAPLSLYKISASERAAMCDASLAFLAHVRNTSGNRPFGKPVRRPREQPVLRAMPRT